METNKNQKCLDESCHTNASNEAQKPSNSSPNLDICISLKGLPEGITLGELHNFEKTLNSLFSSESIILKCINGANKATFHNPSSENAPSYAEELINEVGDAKI